MINNELLQNFNIKCLDKNVDGILWLSIQDKNDQNNKYQICVCYLPPEGSSSNVDPQAFYDTLITQVYQYQDMGPYYLCGDFNSRLGELNDCHGEDNIQERDVIDVKSNIYGQYLQEFLLSIQGCILNGRKMKGQNDFTFISSIGRSVGDYAICPADELDRFDQVEIIRPVQLYDQAGCNTSLSSIIPDHSFILWEMCVKTAIKRVTRVPVVQQVIYDRDKINEDFMNSEEVKTDLHNLISQLEEKVASQDMVNSINRDFCNIVDEEIVSKLNARRIKLSNKCKKKSKAWWNDELSTMWLELKEAEKTFAKAKSSSDREKYKCLLSKSKKQLDRHIQRAKRKYWRKQQETLAKSMNTDSKFFWKEIGKVGVRSEKQKVLPDTVLTDQNEEIVDVQEVKNEWKCHFEKLLNPTFNLPPPSANNLSLPQDHHPSDASLAALNADISHQEVLVAIQRAKRGRACGADGIPVEALTSLPVQQYLTKLYNVCFKTGLVPDSWNNGTMTPIIKDSSIDYRLLNNYRGITLMPHICKLYSSILNNRLSDWSEENNVLCDEQNGFRKSRSCQDHLQSLLSIVQTRKSQNLETFALFVDFRKAYDCIPRSHLWFKLSQLGVNGHFLNAIKSLYKNVKCSVRTVYGMTDVFNVKRGLKQGCVVSPLLFNLYVNDLILNINQLKCGVPVNRKCISMMLFADDIVFLAPTARALQMMLDKLDEWCCIWGLQVNETKTKVVHFRPKKEKQTAFDFKCGNKTISICEKYKYLGLWITDNLDLEYTVRQVAASAHKALGLLIAKVKTMGDISYDCFKRLYDTMVQSVIDYGVSIWGHNRFPVIEAVQNRAIRFYLGLHNKCPVTAMYGDIGWTMPHVHQWKCITRDWLRSSKMDDNRINKHVFKWAVNSKYNNWTKKCVKIFNDNDFGELLDLDNPCSKQTAKMVEDCLQNEYIENVWKLDLNRINAKKGRGLNKLRTYRLFKTEYKTEDYIKHKNINKKERHALAKLRCGIAPLRVELGRFDHGVYIPYEDRICQICHDGVEDECHILLKCSYYNDLRDDLFDKATEIDSLFNQKEDTDKFVFLMSNYMVISYTAKTCKQILDRRRFYFL